MTFDEIAKALGKDEVWVAAAFYGQVSIYNLSLTREGGLNLLQAKFSPEELNKLEVLLGIGDVSVAVRGDLRSVGEHWWPNRGLGPVPPTDPVIYRLYEGVLVYGHAIKVRSISTRS